MSMFSLDWRGFSYERYEAFRQRAMTTPLENVHKYADICVGCVRVGDLCFDLYTDVDEDERLTLRFVAYAGGIDDGDHYGPEPERYPYTEVGSGEFSHWPAYLERYSYSTAYGDFRTHSEWDFLSFISAQTPDLCSTLVYKFTQPLHVW